ncbi:hypothetical protein PFISCL1PPCAC_18853, partial [Pristionchus fissidentatus]
RLHAKLQLQLPHLSPIDENFEGLQRKFEFDDACQIAVDVMDNLVDIDDSLLQNAIGYGFLTSSARNFAFNRFDRRDSRAVVFRRILAKHPEWNSSFRAVTYKGVGSSRTAQLGRNIGERVNRKEDYVVIVEE